MTSFPTVPAFVHHGGWNDTTRKHPATKMMEIITEEFDRTNKLNPKWYAADTSYHKADGAEHFGLTEVMAATEQDYGLFTSHYHEPHSIMCIETDDGYKMLGQAKLFGNLPGDPAKGEKRVEDRLGREWDVCIQGGWFNYYVRDESADSQLGMVIKKSEAMADGSIPMKAMLKRGLISVKDLEL
jgi:hypothetical protein